MSTPPPDAPPPLLSRICVRPPYLALASLRHHDEGTVSGFVRPEQPLGRERGPITGAEAGRHLAILGSCAAALANPRQERHYYLAVAAELRRELEDDVPVLPGEALAALATCGHVGKRDARAHAVLEARVGDGSRVATVYSLSVTYNVLTENVFGRLFRGRAIPEGPPAATSPYGRLVTPPVRERGPASLVSAPERVAVEQCRGHFEGYPALPVAVVMHKLAALAGQLLAERAGDPDVRFVVQHAVVRASSLAWAGDAVTYRVEHLGDDGADALLLCHAATDSGEDIGEMRLTLRC